MNGESKSMLSLLDVLTCGLGGILLMYMIAVLTAQRLDLAEPRVDRRTEPDWPYAPFVILATTEHAGDGGEHNLPGSLQFKYEASDWSDVEIMGGRGHAVLLARSPPPSGIVFLTSPNSRGAVEVSIFHYGISLPPFRVRPAPSGADEESEMRTAVWPIPAREGD